MTPWPRTPPSAADRAAYVDAAPRSFWLDETVGGVPRPDPAPHLAGAATADLAIVGGGFTGLWTALHAKRDDPDRDIAVLESETCGFSASGRNGGFCVSSLTHGLENGIRRFPDEIGTLERIGRQNHTELCDDLSRYGIACDIEHTGEMAVWLEPGHDDEQTEATALLRRFGHEVDQLDTIALRREVASPVFHGAVWDRTGAALVDPGKLVLGLRSAARKAGVRLYEHTAADHLVPEPDGAGSGTVEIVCPQGRLRARKVVLATSAHRPLLRRVRRYIAPVYDYVLVTEPLSSSQLGTIGWRSRQGIGDASNQFHYYRLTADNRILWGGYDAVYRFGGPVGPRWDDHDETFARLAQHFFVAFPQLEGLRFSHRWGGAIDTCSRFSVFFGTAHDGRIAYATGYTGLGVAASRFGARVALDLVDGHQTEATRLRYVRTRPTAFPPEPLRTAGIQLTRNRLAAADRNGGRRGAWLRSLDRFGWGFDS